MPQTLQTGGGVGTTARVHFVEKAPCVPPFWLFPKSTIC